MPRCSKVRDGSRRTRCDPTPVGIRAVSIVRPQFCERSKGCHMLRTLFVSSVVISMLALGACGSDSDDASIGSTAVDGSQTTTAGSGLFDDGLTDPTTAPSATEMTGDAPGSTGTAIDQGSTDAASIDGAAGEGTEGDGGVPASSQPASTGTEATAAAAGSDEESEAFCVALEQMAAIMTPQGGSMDDLFDVTEEEKAGLQRIADEAPAEINEHVQVMVDVIQELADAPDGGEIQAFLALQTSPKGAQLADAEKAVDAYATEHCDN